MIDDLEQRRAEGGQKSFFAASRPFFIQSTYKVVICYVVKNLIKSVFERTTAFEKEFLKKRFRPKPTEKSGCHTQLQTETQAPYMYYRGRSKLRWLLAENLRTAGREIRIKCFVRFENRSSQSVSFSWPRCSTVLFYFLIKSHEQMLSTIQEQSFHACFSYTVSIM